MDLLLFYSFLCIQISFPVSTSLSQSPQCSNVFFVIFTTTSITRLLPHSCNKIVLRLLACTLFSRFSYF